jgi:hypothetical protein
VSSKGLDEKYLEVEHPDVDVEVLDTTGLTRMEAFKWNIN